ncbi:MAG: isochorismatase [Cyanobacteria bacterium P01_A01_bin.135]
MSLPPLPEHYQPQRVGEVWRVPYQERVDEAIVWREQQSISAATDDAQRVGLLLIDVQNTFCIPDFELFVGGRSGQGAVEDNRRLCEFIYRNLGQITQIVATLDTHTVTQIFHPVFWVDAAGEHPAPFTVISADEVERGTWRVNPTAATLTPNGAAWLQDYAAHYVKTLTQNSKYPLVIWPYHGILGGIGHALVSAVEEACLFHNVVRSSPTHLEQKGSNPLTENYSALRPEVETDHTGQAIAVPNAAFLERLLRFDRLIVAGQAQSHCVAWTVSDLLSELRSLRPEFIERVYLLEDCTSAVVAPEADFTSQATAAFAEFAAAGMHRVRSTEAMTRWPGMAS